MRKGRLLFLSLILVIISIFSFSIFSVSADTLEDSEEISYDNLFFDNYYIKVGYTSVLPANASRYYSFDIIDPNLSIYFVKLSSTPFASVSWDGVGTYAISSYNDYSIYSLFVRDGFLNAEGTDIYFFSFNIYSDIYAVCSFSDLMSNYPIYGNPTYDYFNVSNTLYAPEGLEIYVLPDISLENYFSSYSLGVNAGIITGRNEGMSIGYDLGYSDGVDYGYSNGYSEGYTRGNSDLTEYLENNDISEKVGSPFSLLISSAHSFVTTPLFGDIALTHIATFAFGVIMITIIVKRLL